MRVGTKSILFGYHQFILHPLLVAAAWTKLYGFPFDPRLWLAFFVHDLGYFGKENMDDLIGETHPELGAKIMAIFGKKWENFVLFHSRYYSNRLGEKYSDLCVADKLAYLYYPTWLNVLLVTMSGEGKEYAAIGERRGYGGTIREVIVYYQQQSRDWLASHAIGEGNKFAADISERHPDSSVQSTDD